MKKEEKRILEKNINKLYWISFFGSTNFHLVVFTLFLLSKGFTMSQFFIIGSVTALVSLVTEVPTGAFSDRISRKWSLIISSLIALPVTLTVILSDSFIVVLMALAIGGVASSFISGTDISILYDTLKSLKKEKEFKKVNGKMRWYGALSGAIAGILGGFLAQQNLSYPWWAAFFVGFPVLLIQIFVKEPPFYKDSKENESYLLHLKKSLKISFKEKASYFVLYGSIIWLFFGLAFWLWQPYLKLTGLPITLFGFFYAVERIVSGYSAKQAHKVEEKIGMRASLLLIPLVLALSFILESQFVVIFGFSFIFLQSISSGYFWTVLDDYINTRIPSSKRATVLSIKNMLNSLMYAILAPLMGYLIDLYSLQTGFLLMGVLLTLVSLIFFVSYKSKKFT